MESKVPEWFLSFYESLFVAQLRTVRQLKSPRPKKAKRREDRGMSNMNMAIDILQRAPRPLHISEVIAQVKTKYGVTLDRESLVSALVKKVHRRQGLSRPAPNIFEIEAEGR
jgi:hypothetical protein